MWLFGKSLLLARFPFHGEGLPAFKIPSAIVISKSILLNPFYQALAIPLFANW